MVMLGSAPTSGPLAHRLAGTARPVLIQLPRPDSAVDDGRDARGSVAERIELSGRVLMTWAAKMAALVETEELVGESITVDAPTHWLSLAVALGAGFGGAVVQTPHTDDDDAALALADAPAGVVTADPRAELPPRSLGLILALPRGLEAVLEHPEGVAADRVDLMEALLAEPDQLQGPAVALTGSVWSSPGTTAAVRETVQGCTLVPGPLTGERLSAALRAWERGGVVTIAQGPSCS
ncbi:MAG: hypothetical protein Q4G34_03215 [Micrococcus sp.]|nr:hypothetical protein [Micrococcus sp.]